MNLPEKNITSLQTPERSKAILKIISKAFIVAGLKPSEDDQIIIVGEAIKLINSRYYFLSMDEIDQVIHNGVIGDYHDSYLSVRNINIWLRGYVTEKKRKIALQEKENAENDQMPIVERGNFLLKNIDKLPSLKKLMEKTTSNRK